jgi:hypothetical protein
MWDPERLPSSAHLREDLPTKMFEDLAAILDDSYSRQAAISSFTSPLGRHLMPNDLFMALRDQCEDTAFQFNYEEGSKAVVQYLSHLVSNFYYALTGKTRMRLEYYTERHTLLNQVISDFSYEVGRVHILGQAKSSKVFNHFIEELVQQMVDGSSAPVCVELVQTNYNGYKAVLATWFV